MNLLGQAGDIPMTYVRGQHTFDTTPHNLADPAYSTGTDADFHQPLFAVVGANDAGVVANPPAQFQAQASLIEIDKVINPTGPLTDPHYHAYVAIGGNPWAASRFAGKGANPAYWPFITLEAVVPVEGAYRVVDSIQVDDGTGGDWRVEVLWPGGRDTVTFHRSGFLGDPGFGEWPPYYYFFKDDVVSVTYLILSQPETFFGVFNSLRYVALRPTTGVRPPGSTVHSVPSPPFQDPNAANGGARDARTHFWRMT